MEEETTGNQAFVLAIMGSCFSNTHKGVQAGFGEACTMDFTLVRNAISQQARGDMLLLSLLGDHIWPSSLFFVSKRVYHLERPSESRP